MIMFAITLILFGIIVLFAGRRLALLGAGVGALLGLALLRLLPGAQESLFWLIFPIGLAVIFAIGAGFAKGMIGLVSLALGALAGGAIALAVLDLLGLDFGFTDWILALVGAVIGAGLMSRFKNWSMIILASLVGAFLMIRGVQILLPSFDGYLAGIIGLALAGTGMAYQGGLFGKRKSARQL